MIRPEWGLITALAMRKQAMCPPPYPRARLDEEHIEGAGRRASVSAPKSSIKGPQHRNPHRGTHDRQHGRLCEASWRRHVLDSGGTETHQL